MQSEYSTIFEKWLKKLNDKKAKTLILSRLRDVEEKDLLGDYKPVGDKIIELRIHYGPGYRLYSHVQGKVLLVALYGDEKGTKKEQNENIKRAERILKEWLR